MKVEVENKFLTQHLGLSIFYPNLGSNNPALFRVMWCILAILTNSSIHTVLCRRGAQGRCEFIFLFIYFFLLTKCTSH